MKHVTFGLLLVIATLAAAPNAFADWCQWEERDGQLVFVCYPTYYTWMSYEPDWCLYNNGDRVEREPIFENRNGILVLVGWRYFVYPYDDPAGNHAGFYYVVHDQYGNCYLFCPYPC